VDLIEEKLPEELYSFGIMEVEAELYKLNVYGNIILRWWIAMGSK